MLTRCSGGGLGTAIAVGMYVAIYFSLLVKPEGAQSRIPEFIHFQRFEVIVVIWLAFSAVTDTAITISLVWHLVSTTL